MLSRKDRRGVSGSEPEEGKRGNPDLYRWFHTFFFSFFTVVIRVYNVILKNQRDLDRKSNIYRGNNVREV